MYAIDQRSVNGDLTTAQCSKSTDCLTDTAQMCCVNAIISNYVTGVQDSIYRCMNKYVTETDYDVKINQYAFALKCVDQRVPASQSVISFTAITAALGLALISTSF